MLSSLLTWLDASPTRHWSAAWGTFGVTALLAIAPFFSRQKRAWWQHPAWFTAFLLLAIFAFRWPVVMNNTQIADPDESQLMAGALTLRHDPLFWRSVDGTTHGPLAELPLLAPLLIGQPIDFTTARVVSTLLAWAAVLATWMVFGRLVGDGPGRLLTLPLLAIHAFTHNWYFAPFCSEHAPAALLAVGCAFLLTAWNRNGREPRRGRLFVAGLVLGAVPFAKLQSLPIAAWAFVAGGGLILATVDSDWAGRRRALLSLVLGGLTLPALILSVVALNGIWSDFWQCYIVNNLSYAQARWFTWAETPAKLLELGWIAEGFNPFFLGLLGFSTGGLLLWPRLESWPRRCILFSGGLLLTAAYATMAPGRMFMHYIQLMMFPAGLFGGIVAAAAIVAIREGRIGRAWGFRGTVAVLILFLACALLPQIIWRCRQDYPYLTRFTATRGKLVQSDMARELLRHARPGESLAIWGWMPTYWVETGLIQGTRDGNAYRQIEASPEREVYRARFLADLRRTHPPLFVDAVGGNNFAYQDRATQAHETDAPLRNYIAAGYRLVGEIDGSRIYVRHDRP